MRCAALLAALVAGLILPAEVGAGEHRGTWRFEVRPYRIVPFPYVSDARAAGGDGYVLDYGTLLAAPRGGRRPIAPWRYDPDPNCRPPYCLPSYYRPAYPRPPRRTPALPPATLLERLQRTDYGDVSAIALVGANYAVDARDRFGRPVRLIVNAGTGQIRRILR